LTKEKGILALLGLVFVGLHLYLGQAALSTFAPTYDEPVHLTAGYTYLTTGDYRFNGDHHPAFGEMWAALPLIFTNPTFPVTHPAWMIQRWTPREQYRFADTFLFKNRVSPKKLMSAGRWMQLLLSVFLGILLFCLATKMQGPFAGVLALGFWAFSPTLLAHGTLVSTDLSFAIFFFCFFASLYFWSTRWGSVWSGLALGLCLGSKYLAIALFPALGLTLVWLFFSDKENRKTFFNKKNGIRIGIVVSVAVMVLVILYHGTELPIFWEGLKRIVLRAQQGRSSYFLGEHRTTGWLLYFPVLFLIKTPIPTLLGLVLLLIRYKKSHSLIPSLFVIPPLLYFCVSCFSKVQIGHRHILLLYPFIILGVAVALSSFEKKWKWIPCVLLFWLFVESWRTKPHYLAYFNQFIGGPSQGYRYVTDSNVDWGQGLSKLKEVLEPEDQEKGIFLSYFGVADPNAYGLTYIDVGSDTITGRKDHREKEGLNPTKLAISVTNLQATYYDKKNVFDWLKEKTPSHQIAHSLFVYDLKDDPNSLKKLMIISGFEPQTKK